MASSALNYQDPSTSSAGHTWLGHPPGLFILFLVEMWERFSYYGMRGLLILYLKAELTGANPGRGWTQEAAANLFGWYAGMAYFLPVFGGFIADKFIGAHRSLVIGGLAIALGHIVLACSGIDALAHNRMGMAIFVAGLVLITIGTGHFKPNVSVMVGKLYADNDPRRDGAFTIFYVGINLGAFICAFVCGTLGEKVGWHWGFGAAAVGMLLGLCIYLATRPFFLAGVGLAPAGRKNDAPLFFLAALVIAAVFAAIYYVHAFLWMSDGFDRLTSTHVGHLAWFAIKIALAVAVMAGSIWFVCIQKPGDRGPTVCILFFIVLNAIFWLGYEQAGTSMNLFAADSTNRYIFRWEMPATWFQSVNPLLIMLFAPLFAALWSGLGRKNLNPGQPLKAAMGLILLGLGFVFMVGGSLRLSPDHKVSMFWLFAAYTIITLGEMCISPTGLSFLTRTAPVRYVSFLMGLWFVSNAIANKLGGQFAGQMENIEKGNLTFPWYRWVHFGGKADFFFVFVVTSIGAGLIMLILTPLMNWLLRGQKAAD